MGDHYLILSTNAEITPDEFISAWNKDEKCCSVAIAQNARQASPARNFNLSADILLALITGVTSNMIYDKIKRILVQHGIPRKCIHIRALKKPDGTFLLTIDVNKK